MDQLIAEHKSGKGWGAIAKERNVKLGPMVSELKKSDEALEAKGKKADKGNKGKDPSFSDESGARGAGAPGRAAGHGVGRGK